MGTGACSYHLVNDIAANFKPCCTHFYNILCNHNRQRKCAEGFLHEEENSACSCIQRLIRCLKQSFITVPRTKQRYPTEIQPFPITAIFRKNKTHVTKCLLQQLFFTSSVISSKQVQTICIRNGKQNITSGMGATQ